MSLSVNIIIILCISFVLYKKGGIKWAESKVSSFVSSNHLPFSTYYYDRTSQFNSFSEKHKIIFLGDSLTDGCEWSEIFNNNNIVNRGISKDTTKGVLNRIREITTTEPSKVFILIGINDLDQNVKESDIIKNYEQILRDISIKVPQTKVYVQSVLPINETINGNRLNDRVISLNKGIETLTRKYNYTFIDLHSLFIDVNDKGNLYKKYTNDGVHLNGEGYKVWKGALEKYIND